MEKEFQIDEITLQHYRGIYKKFNESEFWISCKKKIREAGGEVEMRKLLEIVSSNFDIPWDSPKRIRAILQKLCNSDPECTTSEKQTGRKGRPPKTIKLK